MNDIQPSKPDPKGKAIASFWIGIINIILSSLFFLVALTIAYGLAGGSMEAVTEAITKVLAPPYIAKIIATTLGLAFFLLPLLFLISIIGVILGFMGLKSSKRNLAKVGIVLSIISLLFQGFYVVRVMLFMLFASPH